MSYSTIASSLPYYDDYDKTKNYLALLFNPGRNVQARELTQIQSVLQNQITSFASHIFRDNSIVVNANISHTSEYYVLEIDPIAETSPGQYHNLDAASLVQQLSANDIITGSSSSAVATVTHIDQDNHRIYYKSTSGGAFLQGESITTTGVTLDTEIGGVPTYKIASISNALLASCDSGIVFHEGRFIIINPQSIIVDSKTTGHYHIGFVAEESATTIAADSTLGDPAAGFNNATSAGADRFKINLKLAAWETSGAGVGTIVTLPHIPANDYPLLGAEPSNFVEYMVIENSTIIKSTDKVNYADILDLLARRTYDESGNYTITDFPLTIEDHATDTSLLELNLQPGKSYIEGFEVEKQQTTTLDINKARTTLAETNVTKLADFGQYVDIGYNDSTNTNDLSGLLFDVAAGDALNFYASNDLAAVITTATAIHISRAGENIRLYLTDIVNASGIASCSVVQSSAAPANSANLKLTNGIAVLGGADSSPIVDFGFDVVKSFDSLQTNYTYTKLYTASIDATGTATITAPINTTFASGAILAIQTPLSGWDINDAAFTIGITSGAITIYHADAGDWTATTGSVQVLVQALKTSAPFRTKTPVSVTERIWVNGTTSTFSDIFYPADANATSEALAAANYTNKEDGIRIISVVQPLSTATDQDAAQFNLNEEGTAGNNAVAAGQVGQGLTSKQLLTLFKAAFNNGQADYFYDNIHFKNLDIATLKQNWAVSTTDVYYDVTYEYYVHDSAGSPSTNSRAFAPTSYPADRFDSIPYYKTANGALTYDLNKCLDFRLKRSELATSLAEFPMPGSRVSTDLVYYLSRIDKVYLTTSGSLGILYGIPSTKPIPPDDIDGAMTMYVIEMPAYTYTKENVTSTQIDNKRYTMRDIGKIERRLEALEEYSALSLLEKSATDMAVLDANGYDKFKSGIFVDSFSTYSTQNTNHDEHRFVINPLTGHGKSPFIHNFFDISISALTNTVENANTITLAYTEVVLAQNDKASTTINVNPYLFYQWNGTVTITPSIDNWIDVNYAPAIRDSRNVEKLIFAKPYEPPAPEVTPIIITDVPEELPPVLPGLPSPPPIVAQPLPEVQADIISQIWTGIKDPGITITRPEPPSPTPVPINVTGTGFSSSIANRFHRLKVF